MLLLPVGPDQAGLAVAFWAPPRGSLAASAPRAVPISKDASHDGAQVRHVPQTGARFGDDGAHGDLSQRATIVRSASDQVALLDEGVGLADDQLLVSNFYPRFTTRRRL